MLALGLKYMVYLSDEGAEVGDECEPQKRSLLYLSPRKKIFHVGVELQIKLFSSSTSLAPRYSISCLGPAADSTFPDVK